MRNKPRGFCQSKTSDRRRALPAYDSEREAIDAAVKLADQWGESAHVVVDGSAFYALTGEQWDRSGGYRLYEISPERNA